MRRGTGRPTKELIERIRKIVEKDNLIHIIDEIWITPVQGYWLSQDCMRWEGQVRGVKDDKPVVLCIESWEKIKDCNCKGLQYTLEGYNNLLFHSGK